MMFSKPSLTAQPAIAESMRVFKSVYDYPPSRKAAENFDLFIDEVIERLKRSEKEVVQK
ncbi:MAG: hypothetical protein QNJ54_18565 [Prochloraceae cyanobacterium]|nr:hypothetical protein [Prochloraceae cyanobacterium]